MNSIRDTKMNKLKQVSKGSSFTLTLEGQVKKWCHTLPTASIHSFEKLVKELDEAFEKYDYQDGHDRINQLRMKSGEYLEGFLN